MEVATGYYINIFKKYTGRFGLYIILNEPNSVPTPEEVDKIVEIVEKQIQISPKKADIEFAIENSGLQCVDFGFQLVYDTGEW